MKTIGKHTLSELMPHIKSVAFEYGLKVNRVKLDEGGPVKPISLADYLKLGLKVGELSEEERKSMQDLLDKMLGVKKK